MLDGSGRPPSRPDAPKPPDVPASPDASVPGENDEQIVQGTVSRVTFHNSDNGYTVLQLAAERHPDTITVVGTYPRASAGAHILVRGRFINHPRFGRQLSAHAITETLPSTPAGMEKYLASGTIKGVGEKTAQRIVEEYGEDAFTMIRDHPERVARLPGVGKKRAQALQDALQASQGSQELLRFLVEHHVPQMLAGKILDRYGNKAAEVLSSDPYVLAREMKGVGFVTADRIALNLGLDRSSSQRLRAGLAYALEKAADDGHTFLMRNQLLQKALFLLELPETSLPDLEEGLQKLFDNREAVAYSDGIYLRRLELAERATAHALVERARLSPLPSVPPDQVEHSLREAAAQLGIEFSEEQRHAVRAATTHRLLVITGGPGCGKTTIIRGLTTVFRRAGLRIFLAAPTGRAAQRVGQVCEIPASTIHRLLKFDPVSREFLHNQNDPLPADVVIIDETSMVDILLARDLFAAIPKEATVVLVGDKDQLPSVGPGRAFGDILTIPQIRALSLSRLFRRNEDSAITACAHSINSGIVPEIPEPDGTMKTDAYFLPRRDADEAALTIEKLVAEQLPKKFGFSLDQIAVLTPSNRGPLGAEQLNHRLQAKLNPPGLFDSEQEIAVHHSTLRVGDRVCQRVNNYTIDQVGVFNGDLGKIQRIDRKEQSVWVELWDGRLIRYTLAEANQLSLAYALTVHRAQGSEIPCVVLALHDSHFTLLDRQLIYTAITRAKKLLVIVGSRRALSMAVRRTAGRRRNTMLKQRFEALWEALSARSP